MGSYIPILEEGRTVRAQDRTPARVPTRMLQRPLHKQHRNMIEDRQEAIRLITWVQKGRKLPCRQAGKKTVLGTLLVESCIR